MSVLVNGLPRLVVAPASCNRLTRRHAAGWLNPNCRPNSPAETPASRASARKIARTIAESPLVKTAFAGEDANWGRIAMAVGRADEPMNRERMSIKFGPLWAARDGLVAADYSEAKMSAYMKKQELEVSVDVGVGRGHAVVWTCDLTKQYVAINGDYRS